MPLESDDAIESMTTEQRDRLLGELEERTAPRPRGSLKFQKAAQIRDKLKELRAKSVEGVTAAAS